jgi:hypothetical protein
MRVIVRKQIAKGLPEKFCDADSQNELRPEVLKELESIKWYLWHGNILKARMSWKAWKWTWTPRHSRPRTMQPGNV